MVGFGIVNYLIGHYAKRVGAFQTSFWTLATRVIFLLILAPFLFNYSTFSLYIIAIALLAGLSSTIGGLGLAYGMKEGNISVIVTIDAAYPVVTIVLGLILLNEPITTFQALCIVLIMFGNILAASNLKGILNSAIRKTQLGVKFALLAMVGWGLFFFFLGILTAKVGWFQSAFLASIAQVIFYFVYGYATKSGYKVNMNALFGFFVMGFISLVAFLAYNIGVTYNYISIVTPISAASIIVTVLMAMILMKEKLASSQKIGVLISILGIILLSL